MKRLRKIDTKEMITRVVPLSDVQEAVTELLQARRHIKTLIAP